MMNFAPTPRIYLPDVDPDAGSTAHQLMLEAMYNKNQLIPRIREEFESCEEFDFRGYLKDKKIPISFGIDLLVQMALHKRTTLPILVGILSKHFEDAKDPFQTCADMLDRAIEADLVQWMPINHQLIVVFDITKELQRELDMFQFPLPMVVQPKDVTNNREDGYLTVNRSLLLRNTHHDDDICLDHINRANRVRFTINMDTAMMIKNSWRNLDKQKADETPLEFKKRKRAFEKYDRTSREVLALLVKQGNLFYFTHRYDKRGRTYCQGYHASYQSTPWSKAILELYDKEPLKGA